MLPEILCEIGQDTFTVSDANGCSMTMNAEEAFEFLVLLKYLLTLWGLDGGRPERYGLYGLDFPVREFAFLIAELSRWCGIPDEATESQKPEVVDWIKEGF